MFYATTISLEACQNFPDNWHEELDFAISEEMGIVCFACHISQIDIVRQMFCIMLIAA